MKHLAVSPARGTDPWGSNKVKSSSLLALESDRDKLAKTEVVNIPKLVPNKNGHLFFVPQNRLSIFVWYKFLYKYYASPKI